jgi:type I restriction enzyme M protein
VFKPYAVVSTAILLFTKGGETNHVWFYDMQADGYSLDDKRNKIAESDLIDIVEKYKNRLNYEPSDSLITAMAADKEATYNSMSNHSPSENQKNHGSDRRLKYFMVPKKEIVENNYDLNLSTYKEEVYEEVSYEKPNVIFKKLHNIELAIQKGLSELKELAQ